MLRNQLEIQTMANESVAGGIVWAPKRKPLKRKKGEATENAVFTRSATNALPITSEAACKTSGRIQEVKSPTQKTRIVNLDRVAITPPTIAQVSAVEGQVIPESVVEKCKKIADERGLDAFHNYTRLTTDELSFLYTICADQYLVPKPEYRFAVIRSTMPNNDPELARFGVPADLFGITTVVPYRTSVTTEPKAIPDTSSGLFSETQKTANHELLNASVLKLLSYAADPIVNSPICVFDIECYPNISFLRYVVFYPNGEVIHKTTNIGNYVGMETVLRFFSQDKKMIIIGHNANGYDAHILQYGATHDVTPDSLYRFSRALVTHKDDLKMKYFGNTAPLIYTVYTRASGSTTPRLQDLSYQPPTSFRVYDTVGLFPGLLKNTVSNVTTKVSDGTTKTSQTSFRGFTSLKTIAGVLELRIHPTPIAFDDPIKTSEEFAEVVEYNKSDVDVLMVLVAEKFEVIRASMAHARLYNIKSAIQKGSTRASEMVKQFAATNPPRSDIIPDKPIYPLTYTHPTTLKLLQIYKEHPDAGGAGNMSESIQGTDYFISLNDGGVHSGGYTDPIIWGYDELNPNIASVQVDIASYYPFAMKQPWVCPAGFSTFPNFVESLYSVRLRYKGLWSCDSYFKLVVNSLSGLLRSAQDGNVIYDPNMGRSLTRNLSLFMSEVVFNLAEAGFPAVEVNTDGFSVLFDTTVISAEDFKSVLRYQLNEVTKKFGEFKPEWEYTVYDRGILKNSANYIVKEPNGRVKAKGTAFSAVSLEKTSGDPFSTLFHKCFLEGRPFTIEELKKQPLSMFHKIVRGAIHPIPGTQTQLHTIVITTDKSNVLYGFSKSGPVDPDTGDKGFIVKTLAKSSEGYVLASDYVEGVSPPIDYDYYMRLFLEKTAG